MKTQINYINPDGLFKSPAFSQVVTTQGNGKTIYIGGQNAVTSKSEVVGKGDIKLQTEQVMKNIQIALEACGASFENLVKMSIHIVQGQNVNEAFQASQKFMSGLKHQPAITVSIVASSANPDYLLEIDAIAFIAE